MGARHYPFIRISCTPDEANVVPGEVLELSLVAENHLFDDTFRLKVEVIARLETGRVRHEKVGESGQTWIVHGCQSTSCWNENSVPSTS